MNPTTPQPTPMFKDELTNIDDLRKQTHDKPTSQNIDKLIDAAKQIAIADYLAAQVKYTSAYMEDMGWNK